MTCARYALVVLVLMASACGGSVNTTSDGTGGGSGAGGNDGGVSTGGTGGTVTAGGAGSGTGGSGGMGGSSGGGGVAGSGGSTGVGGTQDAAHIPDAADGGPSGTVETLGGPCSPPGTLACAGSHQKLTLVCGSSGTWVVNQTCGVGEFCETTPGANAGICVNEPNCSDGIKNGSETDVDCGGPTCPPCFPNRSCAVPTDCAFDICTNGICQDPCQDGVKDFTETDVDCGGGICNKCPSGRGCLIGFDCVSGVCSNTICR
jgi:hypothetical protein